MRFNAHGTVSRTHDAMQVKPLWEQVKQEVEAFYGDGPYDTCGVRDHLEEEKMCQIIPLRGNAKSRLHGNSKV
ncbi:transposase [Botrimarina mediterranea]|uniref:Transposase IS4-like domain-containing protein n=1 Tax=Botrimarina mediterranea TaxID=2528022 RepID=A0A518K7J1_9BACT|nr:transposase [Botrimarina mediterranea]QDV73760.1 hypothetical protein Spa11_19590 [Botrimarina mediterranea]